MISKDSIKDIIRKQEFDLVGIAPVDLDGADVEFWRQWLGGGCHGEMTYLENPARQSIEKWYPEARSIIMAALSYKPQVTTRPPWSSFRPRIRVRGRLQPESRPFYLDTGPAPQPLERSPMTQKRRWREGSFGDGDKSWGLGRLRRYDEGHGQLQPQQLRPAATFGQIASYATCRECGNMDDSAEIAHISTLPWTTLLRCPHTHKADDEIPNKTKMRKNLKEVMPILPLR